MLLDQLTIVLVEPRFPENIGMVARACANMGCPNLALVRPLRLDSKKSAMLATSQGLPILESAQYYKSIEEAIADAHYVVGTTARRGGFRRALLTPDEIAPHLAKKMRAKEKICLLFGREDRGLENTEIPFCQELVSIPTDTATSLNLAQAVLLLLYECRKKYLESESVLPKTAPITIKERNYFLQKFKETLLLLDCLHGDNVDYFFLPWQRFFGRISITRKEYDALMGLCRQIQGQIQKNNP